VWVGSRNDFGQCERSGECEGLYGGSLGVWEGGAEMCKRKGDVGTLVKYPRERDERE
jgi:hypothetical protein